MKFDSVRARSRRGILELSMPHLLLLIAAANAPAANAPAADEPVGPRYDAEGALIPPANYREWVFMSSGLDMSYSDAPALRDHSLFDNVFVDPVAWSAFKRTGHWPDKTMFVLEVRGASTKGSINKQGYYQTEEQAGVEVHVRDESRFKGGWGFFDLAGDKPAELLPSSAPCYACHLSHGAVDTTFTQFYPTAKIIAEKAGTLRGD
jgi:cytochrome P460